MGPPAPRMPHRPRKGVGVGSYTSPCHHALWAILARLKAMALQSFHDALQSPSIVDRPSHRPETVPARRLRISLHIRRYGRVTMDMQRHDGSCPEAHPGGSHGHYLNTVPGRRTAARLDGSTSQDAPHSPISLRCDCILILTPSTPVSHPEVHAPRDRARARSTAFSSRLSASAVPASTPTFHAPWRRPFGL